MVSAHKNGIQNPLQLIQPSKIRIRSAEYDDDIVASISWGPTLIDNGSPVEISVSSSQPGEYDWVAVYPQNADVNAVVPLYYEELKYHPAYAQNGQVNLTFDLINYRTPVTASLFNGYFDNPNMLAQTSNTLTWTRLNAPMSPRVVPTGNPDSVWVVWSAGNAVKPVLIWDTVSHPTVPNGKSPAALYKNIVAATTKQITQADLCGAPATGEGWWDVGTIAIAEVTGLTALAGKEIFYRFGDDATAATDSWCLEETSLLLAPLAGTQPPSRPTEIIAFADLGRGSNVDGRTWDAYGRPAINTTIAVTNQEVGQRKSVDAIWHVGDISYARGYMSAWPVFEHMVSPMVSQRVYATGLGNHESDWPNSASYWNVTDSGGECGVMSSTLFPMPRPASTNQPWYSFNVGLVHIVTMSSEHNFTTGSPQWRWLAADLASVDRTVTPWVVFGAHRPMYIDSSFGGVATSDLSVAALLQEHVEPLFMKYKVNLAMYGHHHSVQRHAAAYANKTVQHSTLEQTSVVLPTYPVTEESTVEIVPVEAAVHHNPQATVHLVAGTAGANFSNDLDAPAETPEWVERTFFRWGYLRLRALNATVLMSEWVDNLTNGYANETVVTPMAGGETGLKYPVIDRMLLVQDDPFAPFAPPA